jgi:hypothetical protein
MRNFLLVLAATTALVAVSDTVSSAEHYVGTPEPITESGPSSGEDVNNVRHQSLEDMLNDY